MCEHVSCTFQPSQSRGSNARRSASVYLGQAWPYIASVSCEARAINFLLLILVESLRSDPDTRLQARRLANTYGTAGTLAKYG